MGCPILFWLHLLLWVVPISSLPPSVSQRQRNHEFMGGPVVRVGGWSCFGGHSLGVLAGPPRTVRHLGTSPLAPVDPQSTRPKRSQMPVYPTCYAKGIQNCMEALEQNRLWHPKISQKLRKRLCPQPDQPLTYTQSRFFPQRRQDASCLPKKFHFPRKARAFHKFCKLHIERTTKSWSGCLFWCTWTMERCHCGWQTEVVVVNSGVAKQWRMFASERTNVSNIQRESDTECPKDFPGLCCKVVESTEMLSEPWAVKKHWRAFCVFVCQCHISITNPRTVAESLGLETKTPLLPQVLLFSNSPCQNPITFSTRDNQ